ncbi:MAG: BlaI/MecI/CopY family transcriptional regulator [Clostridiales bacterium]|nr:BlaI/MecI/CopY family transcriptional regulator [Clostridiales bacterium]
MTNQCVSLTNAEWSLMECLWESSPRTGREAVEYLKKRVGWKRSTTLTMLRRMTEKGIIKSEKRDGITVYSPLIRREQATIQETQSFLDRVYRGSVSMMLNTIAENEALTKEEIDELYEILRRVEEARE